LASNFSAKSIFFNGLLSLHMPKNTIKNTNDGNYSHALTLFLASVFTITVTQLLAHFVIHSVYILRTKCIQTITLLTQLCNTFNTTLTTKTEQRVYYKQVKLWLLNKVRKRLRVRLRILFITYLTQILLLVYLYCKLLLVYVLNQVPAIRVKLISSFFKKFVYFECYLSLTLRRFHYAL
jgi:hypothetical protein